MIQVRHKKRIGGTKAGIWKRIFFKRFRFHRKSTASASTSLHEGLFFCHQNLLCCPDQMLAMMELSQHLVSSSKTVRPQGARCVGHVKIMLCGVCLLASHSQIAEEARPYLCIDEPNRPKPVRRQLSLIHFLVRLIPIGLELTLRM